MEKNRVIMNKIVNFLIGQKVKNWKDVPDVICLQKKMRAVIIWHVLVANINDVGYVKESLNTSLWFWEIKGLQFAKANNLEEINNSRKIRESRERESQIVQIGQLDQIDQTPFGIHKIFTCICDPIYGPFELNLDDDKKCWAEIGFWFFGFFVIYFYTIIKFIDSRVHLNNDQSCVSSFFYLIVISIGIFFPIPYQALFSALLTPFILVCLMKYEFFYKLLMFFGIGNSS